MMPTQSVKRSGRLNKTVKAAAGVMRYGTVRSIVVAFAVAIPIVAKTSVVSAAPERQAAGGVTMWQGSYLGLNVGGGFGNSGANSMPNDFDSATLFGQSNIAGGASPGALSFRSGGVLGGLQFGRNWRLNPAWLVGLEADFDGANIKGSGSSTSLPFGLSATSNISANVEWFGTVRSRIGYLPFNSLLTFVTGGFAYGNVARSANYVNSSGVSFGAAGPVFGINCVAGAPSCASGSDHALATGWTLGAGLEYSLLNNLTFKAEYLYVSIGAKALTETAADRGVGTVLSTFNANFDRTSFNVLRVGLNRHF